jgi:leader peptidase (prepilin peptidase)/N-methyltransferase
VDAMGLGDVKMLAMIGAFLGWRQVWVVLFFASFTGAIVGVTLIALGRRAMSTKLPFGTFLALAAYAASLWGEPLLDWYLQLYQ